MLTKTKTDELDMIANAVHSGLKKYGGRFDGHLPPELAEAMHLRDANTLFLQGEYPGVPVEDLRRNYDAYRDHYVSRHYDLPGGVDDKTFYHLNEQKQQRRRRVDDAASAGVSSAMAGGMKLQAVSEWLKSHPNAGKDEQAAWGKTYDHVQSILNPYRSAVHRALDGGEHEQDVLLDTLADLPELHRELLMRYAATVANQRGKNHMLGVADTVGASAQRTLTDMFTSVARVPGSLKTQVENGQTSFNGPITSMDQALEALSADLQDPRHNYYKRVQQAEALPLRPLSGEEKAIMLQALQREKKRNGLALTMRSILNEAEPLNDSILGKMAAGLGSSLPLVLAATPQGMLAAGAGYANADFHEIMAEHPDMDEDAAARVVLLSGAVKAGLDKLSLFGLGKLAPNVAKVLKGQATSQMVKKIALQAGASYGFENIQEGLQDLTRPAVQSLAASLGQDIPGVNWDREMKQFWASRLDVALGVLPLTLLGIGHNTLQSRQSVLEILNDDKVLKMAGVIENDRVGILKAAQSGDAAKSQALLQEAWNRRDPAVAAAAIKGADGAQGVPTQSLNEHGAAGAAQPGPAPSNQPATAPQQAQPPGHVAPSGQPNGKQSFSTVDAEGREIPPSDTPEPTTIAPAVVPRPPATGEPDSGTQIPQDTTTRGPAPGKEAQTTAPDSQTPPEPGSGPSAHAGIPETTTKVPADAPPGMEPSKEAASAGQVMTLENAHEVLGDIERLKAKEKNGGLTRDEQIDLHHAENLLARAQVTNLEAKQQALGKLPTPRDLHSTELEALAKAKAMLARPWPGAAPASTTTQSSSGSLPPGDTATTSGVTPPAGTATSGHTGTGDTPGTTATGTTTSTASSGGTLTPSTGSGTHTTNGVTAPEIGHGNLIPEDTTHPEHIDLARRRAENLEVIADKRPLNRHEQEVYDNARRVRDRNAPAQPGAQQPAAAGSRNTGNPDDLAMAGDGDALVPVTPDGEDATLDAEADTPPPATSTQPANAIGTTIDGSSTANPDAPRASATDGLDKAGTPASPQQQQPVPPHGVNPPNAVSNGNGLPPSGPPATTQPASSSSLSQSAPLSSAPHSFDSPPDHSDPRIKETFKNWPHGWDEQGLPHPPRTLPDDHDLLSEPTADKKTVRLPMDHPLVAAGLLPSDLAIPRKALHDAIVNHLIRQATPLPTGTTPTIYALGGGGGAGKSSLFQKLMNEGLADARHVVKVDADEIKKYIPEYEQIRAQGDGRAASIVQLESARIADRLLNKLMDPNSPKYHIAYDSTMANADGNLRRIAGWKAAGRRVHLIGVTINPKEAAVRAAIRSLKEGRWVPPDALAKAHQGFNESLQQYLPNVDAADIFDNSSSDFRRIARKTEPSSSLLLEDPNFWNILKQNSHAQ